MAARTHRLDHRSRTQRLVQLLVAKRCSMRPKPTGMLRIRQPRCDRFEHRNPRPHLANCGSQLCHPSQPIRLRRCPNEGLRRPLIAPTRITEIALADRRQFIAQRQPALRRDQRHQIREHLRTPLHLARPLVPLVKPLQHHKIPRRSLPPRLQYLALRLRVRQPIRGDLPQRLADLLNLIRTAVREPLHQRFTERRPAAELIAQIHQRLPTAAARSACDQPRETRLPGLTVARRLQPQPLRSSPIRQTNQTNLRLFHRQRHLRLAIHRAAPEHQRLRPARPQLLGRQVAREEGERRVGPTLRVAQQRLVDPRTDNVIMQRRRGDRRSLLQQLCPLCPATPQRLPLQQLHQPAPSAALREGTSKLRQNQRVARLELQQLLQRPDRLPRLPKTLRPDLNHPTQRPRRLLRPRCMRRVLHHHRHRVAPATSRREPLAQRPRGLHMTWRDLQNRLQRLRHHEGQVQPLAVHLDHRLQDAHLVVASIRQRQIVLQNLQQRAPATRCRQKLLETSASSGVVRAAAQNLPPHLHRLVVRPRVHRGQPRQLLAHLQPGRLVHSHFTQTLQRAKQPPRIALATRLLGKEGQRRCLTTVQQAHPLEHPLGCLHVAELSPVEPARIDHQLLRRLLPDQRLHCRLVTGRERAKITHLSVPLRQRVEHPEVVLTRRPERLQRGPVQPGQRRGIAPASTTIRSNALARCSRPQRRQRRAQLPFQLWLRRSGCGSRSIPNRNLRRSRLRRDHSRR